MGNSCTSVLPDTRAWQQELNKIKKQTNTVSRELGVSMEKSKTGTKKTNPDGLSLPNQNTIIINIIC